MICKIYNKNGSKELYNFEITHFSERLIDGILTLSCSFPIESMYGDDSLKKFVNLSKEDIGKIVFINKNAIVGEYLDYKRISSVSTDYSPGEREGIVLFRQ